MLKSRLLRTQQPNAWQLKRATDAICPIPGCHYAKQHNEPTCDAHHACAIASCRRCYR